MLGDPREAILKDIESFTRTTLTMEHFVTDLAVQYCQFGGQYTDCIYLVLIKGNRLLAYGMELEKGPQLDYDYLFKDGAGESPVADKVSLFCRRIEADNPYQIAMIVDENDESIFEALDHVVPDEEDSNQDFFLRNAMWLLNPVVH